MNLTTNEWIKRYNNVIFIDHEPWELRNKILIPSKPPHLIQSFNRERIRETINEKNALLAHWTDNWNEEKSEWWWTCCDQKSYDIENIKNTSGKRGIKKGLANCSIKRLEPDEFVNLTYNIFDKSILSYKLPPSHRLSFLDYRNKIVEQSKYDGFELWGVFVKDKIASFATCLLVDNVVLLGSTKSDPDLHRYYPNNALFYHITKHYLNERGVLYITNGPRTLLHNTSINDFLIRIGYRQIYGRLNVELSGIANILINSGLAKSIEKLSFLSRPFPNQMAKLKGFLKLIEISNTF